MKGHNLKIVRKFGSPVLTEKFYIIIYSYGITSSRSNECSKLHADYQSNTKVLERAGILSLYSLLKHRRLRWLGHVRRMRDGMMPKDLLYGELAEDVLCNVTGMFVRVTYATATSMSRTGKLAKDREA